MAEDQGFSDEEMQKLLSSGKAQMATPAPQDDSLSDEEIQAALASGKAKTYAPSNMDVAETAVRGALSSATLGATEPVISGGIAAKDLIKQAIEQGSLDPLSIENFVKEYQQDVEARRIQQQAMPGVDVASQVVGAVAPALLTGGASLGIRGALGAAKVAKGIDVGTKVATGATKVMAPLAKAAQIAEGTKLAGVAKTGVKAAEMAAAGVAQEATRQGVLKSTGFMKPGEGPDLDEVAMLGAAIPVVGATVGALAKGAKVAGKGAMSVALGVREADMNKYLANYEKIQAARDVTEIAEAAKANLATIKGAAAKTGADLSTDVLDHLDILGKRVADGSAEAYEILAKSGKEFEAKDVLAAVDKAKQGLLVKGQLVGDANKASFAKLDRLQDDIKSVAQVANGKIDASTIKEVIQNLDTEYKVLSRGEFADAAGVAINKARQNIDALIKEIPEYKAKMQDVAKLADLRSRIFNEFGGSEKKAISATQQALKGNKVRADLLREFETTQPIGFAQAKAAKEAADEINALNELNIGDKLSAFVKGNNSPQLRQQLEKLANLTDPQLMDELNALRANEVFNSGFLRGSRNVNLWTAIGYAATKAAAGAAVGMTIGPGAMALGAVFGGTVDAYGPRIAREILKGVAMIRGIPTVAKIRALSVPEDVKRIMIQDLSRAMRPVVLKDKKEERQLNAFYAPMESRPIIISEIRRASGLSLEEKAQMIQEINKTGKVVDFDKVVFAADEPKSKPVKLVGEKNEKPDVPANAVREYYEYKKRQAY